MVVVVVVVVDGQMQNIETGEPFKFEVKEGDRAYNQKHYEALGEVRSYLHAYYVLFTCVLFTLMKTVNVHSSGHQTRIWCRRESLMILQSVTVLQLQLLTVILWGP